PSPVAGTPADILVEPDETVPVGTPLCRIAAGPAPPGDQRPATSDSQSPKPRDHGPVNGDGHATPVAARIASAHGVDVTALKGSGPRGRVTKSDVLAAVEGDGAPAPGVESKPM